MGCALHPEDDALAPRATQGIAIGAVQTTRAVVWSRTDRPARMRVAVTPDGGDPIRGEVPVDADSDFTGQVLVEGLRPATRYRVEVRFLDTEGRKGPPESGSFRTAPDPDDPAPVRLAWGGDVAGQDVCRDAREGFPILGHVIAERPDVFVGLGDMIYADDLCSAIGRYGNAQVPGGFERGFDLAAIRAHWRYVREDAGLRVLLATTPYIGVWDDHEVVNDLGPHHDTRDDPPYRSGVPLLPLGLRAFREWNPLVPEQPLHRNLRWGRHLELFVLDTRQFRDANFAPDTGRVPKTMLGLAQRRWLEERVTASDATWKVIVSSVPLSIPTGSPEKGRDGWANYDQDTGFERELISILEAFERAGVHNLVWITTDVHFAAVFRYTPFSDAPEFRFLELATGPMNAGLFPNPRYDRTLGPQRLFFYGPPNPERVTSFAEAKRWFSFGVLDVASNGELTARIVNGLGEELFRLTQAPN
jgi:alkaline phosphatase D